MAPLSYASSTPPPNGCLLGKFRNFPFLDNDNIIANLARELPDYLAAADGVVMEDEEEKLAWWAANSVRLPQWASLVKKLLLIQPSSASAERGSSAFLIMHLMINKTMP